MPQRIMSNTEWIKRMGEDVKDDNQFLPLMRKQYLVPAWLLWVGMILIVWNGVQEAIRYFG